jgi:beta-alanine degradation protein BauB
MTLDRTAAAEAVVAALGEQRWFPLDPGNPGGVQMATLWGDPARGPFGALLRVPAGFVSPMHRHSNDERVVVLGGASVHWTRGGSRETAPRMTTGDALLMPAGVDHVSAAADDEDCLEFITMAGRFDFELAEGP